MYFILWFPPNALYTVPTFVLSFRKSFWQVISMILFMIHSRIITDWCGTVSWIPGGTASFRISTCIYTHSTGRIIVSGLTALIYWIRLIIWPIIYNLSLMCPFLSPLSCTVFFSFSSHHPCPLSICLLMKSWTSSRNLSYHLCHSLKEDSM